MPRGLSAADVLDLAEAGRELHPIDRALLILDRAGGEGDWRTMPLGRRDRVLLQLRAATLGPDIEVTAECPACRARLEFSLDTDTLIAEAADPPAMLQVALEDCTAELRALTTLDLARAARCRSRDTAAAALFEGCVGTATKAGISVAASALPAAMREAIAGTLARADPLADITLDLACVACGRDSQAQLDIAAFFWAEITSGARRLIAEVAALARSYGWSERDILAMSPGRRLAYLQAAG